MQVDTDGHVTSQHSTCLYSDAAGTIRDVSDDVRCEVSSAREIVEVALPDLSGYKAQSADKPAEH